MVEQGYLLSIIVQFKVHTVCLQLEYQILHFRETHSELCETCIVWWIVFVKIMNK